MAKKKKLWHNGCLFHNTRRYPRKTNGPHVDRLAGILERGLLAPNQCPEGLVRSDLNLTVTGIAIPYESLIFLHRYDDRSYIYTICEPGRFTVFIDPEFPVYTQEDMGEEWPILSQDEVYVREIVPAESLLAVAIHESDAEEIVKKLGAEFERLGIPLCDYEGNTFLDPLKK